MAEKVLKPAVVADKVCKTYVVTEAGSRDAKSMVSRTSRHGKWVQVLKSINFIASAGESIGLVGQNGSGKSTLLKLLAGAEPVTEGRVLVSSRPTLLGVQPALQHYLTGRQNVILGCLALGMKKREAVLLEPEISSWAEIGDAIDRPMKTYSAGQSARLSFAISTAVHPEILLVDEALSTGDGAFVNKAKKRMQSLLAETGTLFLVSHALSQISENCERVIWIERGEVVCDGETDQILPMYREWLDIMSNDIEEATNFVANVKAEYLLSKKSLSIQLEW